MERKEHYSIIIGQFQNNTFIHPASSALLLWCVLANKVTVWVSQKNFYVGKNSATQQLLWCHITHAFTQKNPVTPAMGEGGRDTHTHTHAHVHMHTHTRQPSCSSSSHPTVRERQKRRKHDSRPPWVSLQQASLSVNISQRWVGF